jgi:hypothetical protein
MADETAAVHGAEPDHPAPPPELAAAAAANPGGSVAQIDGAWLDGAEGFVPAQAVIGAWKVGADGALTGDFDPNPRYRPPHDDLSQLTETSHWLGWLGDDPATAFRASGVDVPEYLTGGRKDPDDSAKLIVTRAGLAAPFALSVRTADGRREVLWGVHSIVAVGLDEPRSEHVVRAWFDLWSTLEDAAERLRARVYDIDAA